MVLTSTLLNETRDNVKADLVTQFLYGAVGSDDTTPTAGDTTLTSEDFRDSVDSIDSSAVSSITASFTVEASENNGNTVKEIGFLDSASGGNLWVHNLVNDINKTSDIILYLDLTVNIDVSEG